jgi:hypothetical protein
MPNDKPTETDVEQQLATMDPNPPDPGNMTTKPKPIGADEKISEPDSGTGMA